MREYPAVEGVGVSTLVGANGSYAIVDNVPRELDDSTPTAPPGYLILPGPTVGQALPDSHPFVMASAFSKYTLAVRCREVATWRRSCGLGRRRHGASVHPTSLALVAQRGGTRRGLPTAAGCGWRSPKGRVDSLPL